MEVNFFQMILWNTLRSMGFNVNWLVQKLCNKVGGWAQVSSSYIVCLSWLHARSLPRELWASDFQTACHVVNQLPPWLGTESSPYELIYHRKPNVSYFLFLGLFVMFRYRNLINLNLTQRPKNAFLLAMILIERVGGVWIWKQRRLLLLDESPTSANLGNDHGLIIKK